MHSTRRLDLNDGACSGNLRWTLEAPSGATLFSDAPVTSCGSDQETVDLTESGTYHVRWSAPAAATGDYRFEVVTVDFALVESIIPDTPTNGAIARGSEALFFFFGEAGEQWDFDILDLNSGTCLADDLRWTLIGPSLDPVPGFDGSIISDCTSTEFAALSEAGMYLLAFDGIGDATDSFQFQMRAT